ncbi:response regulator [bacterium]|nr:response regulator [bacterium]
MEESISDKSTVLLIDDDENILSSLKRLLRREPYSIITAGSGEEAIGILNRSDVDLIVCDYTMPGPTAIETFKLVRKRWPHIVRILMTGHYDTEALVEAVKNGEAYRFVQKPWNDEELIITIRQALERAGLKDEVRRLADEVDRCKAQISEMQKSSSSFR